MRGFVLAVLALGGCFSEPTFAVTDGATCGSKPSAPGITHDTVANQPRVVMPGNRTLVFADPAVAFPMPVAMTVGGRQLIGASGGCAVEDRVGLAVFPIYQLTAGAVVDGQHGATSALTIDGGAAHSVVAIDWTYAHPGQCRGNRPVGRGLTRYSMFPDGRMIRLDRFAPFTAAQGQTDAACQCSNASSVTSFRITSFTSLDVAALDPLVFTQTGDGVEGDSMFPTSMEFPTPTERSGVAGACMNVRSDGSNSTVGRFALRWTGAESPPASNATRIRRAYGGLESQQLLIMVNDLAQGRATISDDEEFALRTTMYLDLAASGRDCATLLGALDDLEAAPSVSVNGAAVPISATGIYNDRDVNETMHEGPVTVSVSEAGPIRAGFALRIAFPGFSAIATDRDADAVVWQQNDDGTFTIWFRDELTSTTPITITPECAPS